MLKFSYQMRSEIVENASQHEISCVTPYLFEKAAPQKSSFQKIDFLVVGRRAGRTYPIAAQEESAISGYVPCQSPRPTLDVN
jgi:hypothetical protein